jgi:hypothetical protein
MEKKTLPIGRQDFRTLRGDNCVYVDKTQHIYNLATQGKAYFLSRPRRFGKSLLLSTMKELFLGSKSLFEDTSILDKWDWTKTSPVVHISFLSVNYEKEGLENGLKLFLLDLYKEHNVRPKKDAEIKTLFIDLIKKIHDKHGRVAILIDEYDKPILDYLETSKIEQAKANQEILGIFYGALKDADAYIRFLFITGISKFTKVSLFSKLNNLYDLTLDPQYAALVGYTQSELEQNFAVYLDEVSAVFPEFTREELLDEIRLWYNGYSWDGKTRLYNPFGILLFLAQRDFQDHWFESGTPTFLVKKMLEQDFFHLETVETDMTFLNKYSLDNVELISLLFQTGYLTIKDKQKYGELVLTYPNKEVKIAMYSFLIDDMGYTRGGGGVTVRHLRKAFTDNDLDRVKNILASLFSGLAFDVYMHQKMEQVEGFYHGLIHILFKCLGIYIQSEVHTSIGRADAVIETPSHIYFLEFKINSDGITALQQIKDKKYADAHKADSRIKIGVGINFNSANKALDGWKTEILA